MRTAVDTNVLLDVLAAGSAHGPASRETLHRARLDGALVICEVVYAELAAAFEGDRERLALFLLAAGIRLERTSETALAEAGASWRAYRAAGGPRSRVLADFLVAAHARDAADRLLSRDRGFYRRWFGDLPVLDPSVR